MDKNTQKCKEAASEEEQWGWVGGETTAVLTNHAQLFDSLNCVDIC